MRSALRRAVAAALVPVLLLTGCAAPLQNHAFSPREMGSRHLARSEYLDLHLRDGSYVHLTGWSVDSAATVVRGMGTRRDVDRTVVATGVIAVPADSIALIEAASSEGMPPVLKAITIVVVTALAVTGIALLAFAIACAMDPKCFGSCPTFYVTDGRDLLLQAEGFSASIAPALEATDVDALWRARPAGRVLEVTMRNEALETHVVRAVRVLAARRPAGGRVVAAADGALWAVTALTPPAHARAAEGDVAPVLAAVDGSERVSEPDSSDLAARETLDLEFPPTPGPLGLVLASRQTLLTTYLFYETLAAMGPSTGTWLAALERADRTIPERSSALARRMGGLEVQVAEGASAWRTVESIDETGPLAADVKLVRLPPMPDGPVHVRLRAARGMYRLDAALLAHVGDRIEPVRLEPDRVTRDGAPDARSRQALVTGAEPVVTGPGDAYTLRYRLPGEAPQWELFLESRGYYLEWMREPWMKGGDPVFLSTLMFDPDRALRELAPAYARERAGLEDWFWRNRYVHP
jgi:hypothetical protein